MKFKSTCHLIVPVENYPHLPKYHLLYIYKLRIMRVSTNNIIERPESNR